MRLPQGILPVVQTPFGPGGEIDLASLDRLIASSLAAGASGFLVPAVASEVAYLSMAEREALLARVLEHTVGRVAVIAGASHADPAESSRLARHAFAAGATAYLVAVPDALYGDASATLGYFQSIAASCPLPLVIQDLQWLGPGLTIGTIQRLRDTIPTLSGIKIETLPAGPKYTAVRRALGDNFFIAGGWAVTQMIEALDRGVDAMIPECSMVPAYVEIARRYERGDREGARQLFARLLPILSYTNQTIETSVAFFKRLLVRRGTFSDETMRMPGFVWDEFNTRIAEDHIAAYAELERSLSTR